MADETYNEIQNLIINTFNEYKDLLKRNRNGEPFLFPLNTSAIPEWERVLRNRGLRNELFDGLSPEGYKYIINQCVELADIYNLSTKNRLMRINAYSIENNESLNVQKPIRYTAPDGMTNFEFSEVTAPADGIIYKVKYWDGINSYGNFIIIEHDDGRYSLLGHLERSLSGVKEGQRIRQGDPIATGGSSGRGSVPPHLHWSVFESVDTFHSNAGDNGIFLGPGYVVNFAKTVNPQILVDSGTYIHPSHGRITDVYGSTIITTGRPYHEGIDYSLKDKRK